MFGLSCDSVVRPLAVGDSAVVVMEDVYVTIDLTDVKE